MAKIGTVEAQREAFAKGNAPTKVVLHYANGNKIERSFHDPHASIKALERWIEEIKRNYIK